MSAYNADCSPIDACGACGTLPPGFVRLRYFYGKRLGVTDFVDEQRYHAGKMRFHNQHQHGAGVVCGLAASRLSAGGVVLRVGKGAALDACGREIVVGYDQCIDVDAWYARVRDERIESTPTWPEPDLVDGRLPLAVVLRYREAAGQPEPAPRDPCSCDASGCDFGRVREEFELDLALEAAVAGHAPPPLFPERAALDRALGTAVGGAPLRAALAAATQAATPAPEGDDWLLVARFAAELDASRSHVVALHDLTATATVLHQAAVAQELLLRTVAAQLEAGALVDGPEIAGLGLERTGTTYRLVLTLSAPVLAPTVTADAFTVRRLDPSTGWRPAIAATTAYVAPSGGNPARLTIAIDNAGGFLASGGLYRLALEQVKATHATPIVDADLRPLRPLRASIHFRVTEVSGELIIADPPYVA
jgi:hypothetical protein